MAQPFVILGKLGWHGTCQQTAPERCIGHEADGQLAGSLEHVFRLDAVEDRIFALDRIDGMHGIGLAQGGWIDFAEPERPDLALLLEARHCPDCLLDRHERVDPVLVIKIDHIRAQPPEACLAGRHHMFWPAVGNAWALPVRIAEFRGDHDTIAPALECATDEGFIVPPTIFVGGVEKVDPEIERLVNETHALVVVSRPVRA